MSPRPGAERGGGARPAAAARGVPRLAVRTVAVDDPGPLLRLPPAPGALAWVRRGEGLVGWGEAARIDTAGPERFIDAGRAWRELAGAATVRDEVGVRGSGLVALGSFAFADDSPAGGHLVVPSVVVGSRGGRSWVTTVSATGGAPPVPGLVPHDAPPPRGVTLADGALPPRLWEAAVSDAVARIEAGEVEKVVLARDLVAHAPEPVDDRAVLDRLAARYPSTWTFAVDGLVGATPELLVRTEAGLVASRVLAGTIRRTGDDQRDLALAASLARSGKDLVEHQYAVRSVADALRPLCAGMNVPDSPYVLHLANVMHLATDVTGVLAGRVDRTDQVSSLSLAAALHPSAAVGGTPAKVAAELVAELEGMDRDRYAGPVGWLDASGDGEWGIALRCGRFAPDRRSVRLFAGCGIVAGSDPATELAESEAKFVPMREALAG